MKYNFLQTVNFIKIINAIFELGGKAIFVNFTLFEIIISKFFNAVKIAIKILVHM